MNGKQAKRIRREVYGDMARRGTKYTLIERVKKVFSMEKNTMVDKVTGQVKCTGLRRAYKDAKRAYKGAP